MALPSIAGPGIGLHLRTETVRMTAHAALSRGNIVTVDITTQDVDTLVFTKTAAWTAAGGGDPEGDQVETGVALIALEDVASGAIGLFAIAGIVTAIATEAVGIGDVLGPVAGDLKIGRAAVNTKACGIALEAAAGDGDLIKIMFSGLSSLGVDAA